MTNSFEANHSVVSSIPQSQLNHFKVSTELPEQVEKFQRIEELAVDYDERLMERMIHEKIIHRFLDIRERSKMNKWKRRGK